jgi:hypothetical protein
MPNEEKHLSVGAPEKERFTSTSEKGKVDMVLASFFVGFRPLGNPVDTLSPLLLVSQYICLIFKPRKGISTL